MKLTTRRLTEQDAQEAHDFLGKCFAEDPEFIGNVAPLKEKLAEQVHKGMPTWVAISAGKIIAIFGPRMASGIRKMPDGKLRTFSYYNRLVIDYAIYEASHSDAIQIAKALSLAAADDLRDMGDSVDDILVTGPKNCKGAAWARLLGFEEEPRKGKIGRWWLESKLIWERLEAV